MNDPHKLLHLNQLLFVAYRKSESFIYPFDIDGTRLNLQNVGDGFDIQYNGTLFATLFQAAKSKGLVEVPAANEEVKVEEKK